MAKTENVEPIWLDAETNRILDLLCKTENLAKEEIVKLLIWQYASKFCPDCMSDKMEGVV
jgi:hypothetical protein